MKVTRFALVAVVLAWASIASAQTVDEVIEKSIAAMGGRPAMEKIKTRSMTGTLSLATPAGDIPGTVEILNAAPNKMRTGDQGRPLGVRRRPVADRSALRRHHRLHDQQPAGQPADHRRPAREHEGQLVSAPVPRLQGQGLQGDADRQGEGRRSRRVRRGVRADARGRRSGSSSTRRASCRCARWSKVNTPQTGEIEQTADASDFRDVDGVKVPFSVRLTSPCRACTMTFTKVENNVAIDDKMFVKP